MWHQLGFFSPQSNLYPNHPTRRNAIQSRHQHNAWKYLTSNRERPTSEQGLGGLYFDCLQRLKFNSPYFYSSPRNSPRSRHLFLILREAVPHWTRVSFCALIPIAGRRSVPETLTTCAWLNLQSMLITLICSVDMKPLLGTLLPPSSQLLLERPSAAPLTSPTRIPQVTNKLQCTLIVGLDSLTKASYY